MLADMPVCAGCGPPRDRERPRGNHRSRFRGGRRLAGRAVSGETPETGVCPVPVVPPVPVPMPADPEFLFVYGTLRRPCAPAAVLPLVHNLEPAGPATMQGDLHDLGAHPAMVPGAGIVHGDLLRVPDAARLGPLDDYEECDGPEPLFHRVVGQARRRDGSEVRAWVYLYARPIGVAPQIADGDYLPHAARRTPAPDGPQP
jgi:gamma-glutamylcyclotransferase (GGCT)/AIG2-like uncharacterized protein YtfP